MQFTTVGLFTKSDNFYLNIAKSYTTSTHFKHERHSKWGTETEQCAIPMFNTVKNRFM